MELLPLLLLHPPISGYYAKSKGHSFWFWFVMGLLLPVISNVILYFLKDKPQSIVIDNVPIFEQKDKILYSKPGFEYRPKNK
jgi:hypothetical protein